LRKKGCVEKRRDVLLYHGGKREGGTQFTLPNKKKGVWTSVRKRDECVRRRQAYRISETKGRRKAAPLQRGGGDSSQTKTRREKKGNDLRNFNMYKLNGGRGRLFLLKDNPSLKKNATIRRPEKKKAEKIKGTTLFTLPEKCTAFTAKKKKAGSDVGERKD